MLLHDSSSSKDPCMPTPWHLCKTPSARPLAKEHAQLVATAALFCTVSSSFSVAPHIQAINHGFRVKLDHKNVSYYGPLRRTIEAAKADLGRATEVLGHAEQVKILINRATKRNWERTCKAVDWTAAARRTHIAAASGWGRADPD